jgi:hypothetical protein
VSADDSHDPRIFPELRTQLLTGDGTVTGRWLDNHEYFLIALSWRSVMDDKMQDNRSVFL